MKNIQNNTAFKREYSSPIIGRIALDHEISLILQSEDSNPELEPTWSHNAPGHFNNDPSKNNIA